MDIVIQFTEREEAKALPILLRQSPGVILRNRTYILRPDTVQALIDVGITFRELSRPAEAIEAEGVASGARI